MAIRFSIPDSPKRSVLTIDTFYGVDFTNSPAAVDEFKSPNAKNMIRDVPGKVRKCMGYHQISSFSASGDGPINGFHKLAGATYGLIHTGTNMYLNGVLKYSTANNARSRSWQMKDKLYILDGKALLVFDGTNVTLASTGSYLPTLTIGKSPSGGGTDYEALNLLNPGFTEQFLGTTGTTQYQLTFGSLDATLVTAKVLSGSTWVNKVETTDFTVNRTTGIVTFITAPGAPTVTGEDNVKITAYRTVSGYADRINKCTIGITYGVSGALDRLFLSGNPAYPNQDWFSGQFDFTYFPDTGYSQLGSVNSAIIGYSIISNYLAAHKDDMEKNQSIILRQGSLVNSEPAFPIATTLQGAGAVGKDTFAYLATEPLFLTKLGIYAITASDISGEKYAQNRSFFLNGKLLEEANLQNAFAYVYKDLYWLCLNNVAYIMDGLQPLQTDKAMPYSTRQYAGFYRTNLPVNTMWEDNGILYFGTSTGIIHAFYNNPDSQESYNDNGVAIEAVWETPDLDGKLFYQNKTFRHLAIRLQSAVATSINIFVQKRGLWSLVKTDDVTARYFSFSQLVFSKFTFSCDKSQKIIATKLRVKKVDKARFRFTNDSINEPFGLFNIALEFVEEGKYKG